MTGSRAVRVVANGARLVTGVAVAAACAIGVVAAVHAPWPDVRTEPAQVAVTPLPGDSLLVCNGDLRAIGRNPSAPLEMRSAATPRSTVGGTSGEPAVADVAVPDLVDGGTVRTLTGEVDGRTAPLIGGAESVTITAEDLAGYAALPCGQPRLESWLVGGSVSTGAQDIVILTNAAAVPTTVTLSVYGSLRSARTVIVPAATQVALPLASIAAGNEAPVLQVTADGAPVRAVLQSSRVQVLDAAGIDLQDSVAGAQQELVIPGVRAFETEGDDADVSVLRLLSPGSDARATVTVRSDATGQTAAEFMAPLVADQPLEVSLGDLAPGVYTVSIEADAPVVGAARQQDGAGRGSDFAWVTPAPGLDTDVVVAVPPGPAPELRIANAGGTEATVTVEDLGGGQPQEVVVPAGGSAAVEVAAGRTYRLGMTATVHAAVALTAPGELAVMPVLAASAAEQPITVYP